MSLEIKTRIRNRFKSKGYADHWIDGILMNAEDESGFNPSAIGDNGNAFGLWQHNGPRKRALENYASERGMDPSDIDTQVDFVDYELKGPESKAFSSLQNTKTSGEAGDVFLRQFERPAEQHVNTRSAKYTGTPYQSETSDVTVGGVTGDPYQSSMALAETSPTPAEPEKPKSKLAEFYDDKMPWITDDRADMLLAIGAGLLSGNDWASGIANASSNMLGLSRQQKEDAAAMAANASAQERWKAEQMLTQGRHEDTLRQREVLAKMEQDNASERQRVEIAGRVEQEAAKTRADEAKRLAEEAAKGPQSVVYNGTEINGVKELKVDPSTGKVDPRFTADFKSDDRKFFNYTRSAIDGKQDMNTALQEAGGYGGINITQITKSMNDITRLGDGKSLLRANVEDFVTKDLGIQDEATKRYVLSATKVANAKLRVDTGAAITTSEMNDQLYRYLPQVGDTEATIAAKQKAMNDDIDSMISSNPDFAKDYLYYSNQGLFLPTKPETTQTATETPKPTRQEAIAQPEQAERIQQSVDEQTARSHEIARVQNGYPDKIAKTGMSREDWYELALLADDPDSGITWDEVMKEYGLTERDIEEAAMREKR